MKDVGIKLCHQNITQLAVMGCITQSHLVEAENAISNCKNCIFTDVSFECKCSSNIGKQGC